MLDTDFFLDTSTLSYHMDRLSVPNLAPSPSDGMIQSSLLEQRFVTSAATTCMRQRSIRQATHLREHRDPPKVTRRSKDGTMTSPRPVTCLSLDLFQPVEAVCSREPSLRFVAGRLEPASSLPMATFVGTESTPRPSLDDSNHDAKQTVHDTVVATESEGMVPAEPLHADGGHDTFNREISNVRPEHTGRPTIQVLPGVSWPLCDARETREAWHVSGMCVSVTCLACVDILWCHGDATVVLCPQCHTLSPVEVTGTASHCSDGVVVGLGFMDSSMYCRPVWL